MPKARSLPPAPLPVGAMPAASGEYAEYIAQALATEGGHLSVGRGGATLHFGQSRLSGCREERIKTECIAAGLPVIDSRMVPFAAVWRLAVSGPMAAVGQQPGEPPYHAFTYAPLRRSRRPTAGPGPRCSISHRRVPRGEKSERAAPVS
jgi:hypothetical protein